MLRELWWESQSMVEEGKQCLTTTTNIEVAVGFQKSAWEQR